MRPIVHPSANVCLQRCSSAVSTFPGLVYPANDIEFLPAGDVRFHPLAMALASCGPGADLAAVFPGNIEQRAALQECVYSMFTPRRPQRIARMLIDIRQHANLKQNKCIHDERSERFVGHEADI